LVQRFGCEDSGVGTKIEPKLSASHNMFSRVRRNVVILLTGNGIASLLGFAALTFNARALGPEQLGILGLLQAFVVVTSVFSFDTWQPVIKFGAEAQAAEDGERLRDIVMFGFVYDLAGALAATLRAFNAIGCVARLDLCGWAADRNRSSSRSIRGRVHSPRRRNANPSCRVESKNGGWSLTADRAWHVL
jgi:hypothetical protein